MPTRNGLWDATSLAYRELSRTDECLNPETAHRVEFCNCRLCRSKLTDPALVRGA